MSVLSRYLLRRNLFLLFALLALGAGVYVLTDLFQRIDTFLDARDGVGLMGLYYLTRLPLIISQILPAVFLISIVAQLMLMAKNRESIALQSGGVSPAAMLRFVIVYGLVWSCLQFAFSQVLGVYGESVSRQMWLEDVRGRDLKASAIEGLLFTQGRYVVHADLAWPKREEAAGLRIYKLSPDGNSMEASYNAMKAEASENGWTLFDVELIEPADYRYSRHESLRIDLKQDLATFSSYDDSLKVSEISLPQLADTITRLERTGTNVEALRTELYGRFAYAGSILVMGILGLALSTRVESIYLGIIAALVLTFLFYAANGFFSAMGQSGALPPQLAAWLANIIFAALGVFYIFYRYILAFKCTK